MYKNHAKNLEIIIDLGESSDISDSELVGKDDDHEEMVRVLDWQPSGLTQALGEWEKHTSVSD